MTTKDPHIPGLPAKPLRDSLTANRRTLGDAAASWIKDRAEKAAEKLELHRLSEEDLRAGLPASDPFSKLPKGRPERNALIGWWRNKGRDAMRTVAIEGQLIENATRGYSALAEHQSEQRGAKTADPLAAVRGTRGEEFAAKVARRAAVLASRLDSMPPQERQARTAALREEIGRTGLDKARFGAIAEAVALQHGRNADNERQAMIEARATDAGAEVKAGAEVDAGAEVGAGGVDNGLA